jgi:hypothetical protein
MMPLLKKFVKLVPKLWKGACVVMDNCSIHLGEEVKKAIEKKGQN